MVGKQRSFFFILTAGVVCAAVFTACGTREEAPNGNRRKPALSGSETTGVTKPQPAPAVEQDNRPVIVTFGDSLTAGVAGRSYPDALQELLDAQGLRFRVDNQGVSGDTTTDGLARIDNVIAGHPALVILEFGGNDGLRGIPVDATRKNLAAMIERLKQAKIPTVLLGITLPPNYGPDYVKPFTAMFPELAREYQLPYIPFLLLHVYQNRELMQPDGIHPNGNGNQIVARDVFQLIRPQLESETKRPKGGEPSGRLGAR